MKTLKSPPGPQESQILPWNPLQFRMEDQGQPHPMWLTGNLEEARTSGLGLHHHHSPARRRWQELSWQKNENEMKRIGSREFNCTSLYCEVFPILSTPNSLGTWPRDIWKLQKKVWTNSGLKLRYSEKVFSIVRKVSRCLTYYFIFQSFLKGETNIPSDEAFQISVSKFADIFLKSERVTGVAVGGGLSFHDCREIFKHQIEKVKRIHHDLKAVCHKVTISMWHVAFKVLKVNCNKNLRIKETFWK